MSFTLVPKQNRQHYLSEFWLVKATPICKAEEASPGSFSPTTQRNDSPRDRTWHGPQKARGWPPTHWHTLRILAVLWDWGAAKPQLHQNKEGTGAYRGGGGGARQGTPHIHKHRFSAGKALRTNPENSVKGRGVCIPPTESRPRRSRSDSYPGCKRQPWLRVAGNPEVEEAQLCLRSQRSKTRPCNEATRVQRWVLVNLG